jgi:hypothetical protein
MTDPVIAARAIVRVLAPDGKRRPGIVLEVQGDLYRVAFGTGTRRDHYEYVEVAAHERAGKQMRLEKDTFFYASNVAVVARTHLAVLPGICSSELAARIVALVDETGA